MSITAGLNDVAVPDTVSPQTPPSPPEDPAAGFWDCRGEWHSWSGEEEG